MKKVFFARSFSLRPLSLEGRRKLENIKLYNMTGFFFCFPDVLSAIFMNVVKSEEEPVRLRLLKFVKEHMRDIPVRLVNEELMLAVEHHVREVFNFE